MTTSALTDAQLNDLAVARTLAPKFGEAADPADLRVVTMVGRRWLRAGRSAHVAAHEVAAVRRAAHALEAADRARGEGKTARSAPAAPVFVSPEAAFAADLVADVRASARAPG